MEELGRDEGGLGEARAEGVEAGVAVVGAEARGERREELVGRRWRAEGDHRSAAGREGEDDNESRNGAERHARNLDGWRPARKGPTATRRYSASGLRAAGICLTERTPASQSLASTSVR